jgi:hypothetical protein
MRRAFIQLRMLFASQALSAIGRMSYTTKQWRRHADPATSPSSMRARPSGRNHRQGNESSKVWGWRLRYGGGHQNSASGTFSDRPSLRYPLGAT